MNKTRITCALIGILSPARLLLMLAVLVWMLVLSAPAMAVGADGSGFEVCSNAISVRVSPGGEISGVRIGSAGVERAVRVNISLAGCSVQGGAQVTRHGRMAQVDRTFASADGKNACRVVERIHPAGNSIRWDAEISGSSGSWSTPIETRLNWPLTAGCKFWTAWDDPRPDDITGWADPLEPQPFTDLNLAYGGRDANRTHSFCIPIGTVVDETDGRGMSLAVSPEDTIIEMTLSTSRNGDIIFSRLNQRLGEGKTVRFSMDLVPHGADWRSALGWMVNRYPDYFELKNSMAHEIAGCGAYSRYIGELDARKYLDMGFRVNWKASYDYLYMGMFLPPVDDDTEWTSLSTIHTTTSVKRLREYSKSMKEAGFSVLNYFNLNDFGVDVTYPAPPRKAKDDRDLWRDANDYVHYKLSDGILYIGPNGVQLGAWENGIVMDPAAKVVQDHYIEQVARHIKEFPESAGICIDRMDYIWQYNTRRDDGVSWVSGKPVRSLVTSWNSALSRIGPMMHRAGKVVFSNPLYSRLDLMKEIDGFYDEFASRPNCMNQVGLLGVRKPAIAWTSTAGVLRPDGDAYMQRHLHMGVYPTAPLPENDHTICPNQWAESYYKDYGPLFDALRGRKWVLQDNCVYLDGAKGKVNLFEAPGGFVVPVTFAGDAENVAVTLRGLSKLPRQGVYSMDVRCPGDREWRTIGNYSTLKPTAIRLQPKRGCIVLRLRHTWIEPNIAWFTKSDYIRTKTTLPDAQIRYTMDGTEPDQNSPVYTQPIKIHQTTTVKAVAFVNGRRFGEVITHRVAKVRPSKPVLKHEGLFFDGSTTIEFSAPGEAKESAIRYTTDGSEPTATSDRYTVPVTLTETAKVKARVFLPDSEPGVVESVEFVKVSPKPPVPDVAISALTPLTATVGALGSAKVNKSIQDMPLTIAGRVYQSGMGVHAKSELVYALRSEYRRFVAVVGVDDEMKDYPEASILFQVFVDGKRLCESPMLHIGQFWHIDTEIPQGSKEIRLVVTDGGDGINCDHGDWANAGFMHDEPSIQGSTGEIRR